MKESQDIFSHCRAVVFHREKKTQPKPHKQTNKTPNKNTHTHIHTKRAEQDKMIRFTVLIYSRKLSISLSVCTQDTLYVNLNAAILVVIIYAL